MAGIVLNRILNSGNFSIPPNSGSDNSRNYRANCFFDSGNSFITQIQVQTMQFNDASGAIIGCAMRVHSALGSGFQEVIYQRALAIEFKIVGLPFEREKEIPIWYRDEQIGTRRVDFFVDNEIMVELKAITLLDDGHLAQTLNYLEAYQMKTGLLLNFGSKSLIVKRLINKKL